jgi:hypothetical protein
MCGAIITQDRAVQEKALSKAQLKRQLLKTKKAIDQIKLLVDDTLTMAFIQLESDVNINSVSLQIDLISLNKAIDLSLFSPMIAKPGGRTKKGRGKALPRIALAPKSFCALVIAETWLFTRGDRPVPGNLKAAAAAQGYWLATGGTSGWGTAPLSSWAYHFREAASETTASLREEIQQRCAQDAHALGRK